MAFRRAFVAAALLLCSPRADAVQDLVVLHIRVTIVDADHHTRPVPRHALLISDNPTSAAPRRTVTTTDGTAEVRLPPGNYTVESDQPLVFEGRAYQWTRTLDVAAVRDAFLELTADNAEIAAATTPSTMAAAGAAPSELLMQWQDSVVAIWSPTARGAGFVIDSKGVIVTNQRLVGTATSVEVQLTLVRKVSARVLAADRIRDVAILWIDPAVVSSVKPVRLGYSETGKPAVAEGQEVFAIDPAVLDQKSLSSGKVTRVEAHAIASDLRTDGGDSGAPLLTAGGDVIGITTLDEAPSGGGDGASRAVRIDEARTLIADAGKKIQGATPPPGTPLPVEPQRPFPVDALKDAVERRTGSLAAYQVPAADFDVSVITPVLSYAAQHRPDRTTGSSRPGRGRDTSEMQSSQRALEDFGNWSDYVAGVPPVLMIRATPKLVEGFWTTVGRAAAQTQGVSLPPMKHIKAGFSRMRLYCGAIEVVPIHPFAIEHRLDEGKAVYEGLYVFDPGAVGPHCGTVKLALFSEKDPDKGDTRVLDAKVVQQIWQDFASYRAGESRPYPGPSTHGPALH